MTPFLQLVFILGVIIFAAKLAGYISSHFGQPSVLGELIIGLLLGPTLIDLAHVSFITDAHLETFIIEIGELGVLFLMFLAGLELHLGELAKNMRVSAYAGSLGVIVPIAFGLLVGLAFQLPFDQALFLGLTIGATSVSISAQTLMELKVLRSRVGLGLLGAAVFDDVLVIFFLSIFLALTGGETGAGGILLVILRMLFFLALSVVFGLRVLPQLAQRISRLPISQGTLSFALVILLVYGVAAELIGGMAAITGTFIAGLMFARTPQKNLIEGGLHSVAYSFFVPIFFVSIGMHVDLTQIQSGTIWLLVTSTLVAILGKIIGSGLGARLASFSWLESLQLGTGMISRGEVGLILANTGLKIGLIDQPTLSAVVGMILITTLVTPPLLRATFNHSKSTPLAPSNPATG